MVRAYRLADVRRTLRKNLDHLLSLPNVVYVGIGEKQRGGEGAKKLSIRVYVSKKVPMRGRGRIPRKLRGVAPGGTPADFYVPTDVTVRPPRLRALGLKGGARARASGLGCIGLPYRTSSGRELLLTNSHVAAPLGSRAIGEPVFGSGSTRLGTVLRATPILADNSFVHFLDASVIEAEVEINPREITSEARRITSVGSIVTGDQSEYFYRTGTGSRKGFRHPNLIESDRPVRVHGQDVRFRDFFELKQISGPALVEGDSGSVLLHERNGKLQACGLVFAGGGKVLAVVRLRDVVTALGEGWTSDDNTTEDVSIDFST